MGSTPERPKGQLTPRAPAPTPLSLLSAYRPGQMPFGVSSPSIRESTVCCHCQGTVRVSEAAASVRRPFCPAAKSGQDAQRGPSLEHPPTCC